MKTEDFKTELTLQHNFSITHCETQCQATTTSGNGLPSQLI